jgi:Flp pilus assembly protein TadG
MRVTQAIRARFARLRDQEAGAVMLIVGLSLTVFLGMLVLTVDIGRGVAFKRQVVNGTDAAALAAAQQCALGNGSVAAQSAANTVLAQNVQLPVTISGIEMPECDAPAGTDLKTVTVTTNADIEYFFAPIFGVADGDIATHAVAVWGVAASANPIPITVDLQQLLDCGIVPGSPPDPDEEIECQLEYPKDTLQEPRWGVLDFEHWGDPDAAPCSVSAAELKDMIDNGGFDQGVELNGDPPGSQPTMTCVDNGLSFSVWDSMEGHTLIFPVIDLDTSTGTVKPGGGSVPCTGADITALKAQGKDCEIDTVNVIAWVVLHVDNVNQNGATVTFDSNTELTTSGGIPGATIDFGVRAVRLVD